jgi:hypothetical protein
MLYVILIVTKSGVCYSAFLVAERVATLNEKLDRMCEELKAEIDNKNQPIAHALFELNGKILSTR